MAHFKITRAIAAVTAAGAVAGSAGCGGTNANNPPQAPTSSTTTTSGDAMVIKDAAEHANGHIAARVAVASKVAINQATEALKRSKDSRVRDFAQRLLADQTRFERDEQSLASSAGIVPMPDEKSDTRSANGAIATTNLTLVNEGAFDQSFLNTTINEQQDFLDALDTHLIPEAQNAALKAMLGRTRSKVADDLAAAQGIQASLVNNK
jgi:putative membrane protein